MLRLHPDKRAKASELVHHKWLDGVIVQGEIDVIRRVEQEEAARKRISSGSGEASVTPSRATSRTREKKKQSASGMTQSEIDALKPVEDAGPAGEPEESPSRSGSATGHAHQQPPRLNAAPMPSSSASAKENASGLSRTAPVSAATNANQSPQNRTSTSSKRRG